MGLICCLEPLRVLDTGRALIDLNTENGNKQRADFCGQLASVNKCFLVQKERNGVKNFV